MSITRKKRSTADSNPSKQARSQQTATRISRKLLSAEAQAFEQLSRNPIRLALYASASKALLGATLDLAETELPEVGLSGEEIIFRLMQHLPADSSRDPFFNARMRGLQRRQDLLQTEGSPLSAVEAAQILGISRQMVDIRRKQGKLIGIRARGRRYSYPCCQFTEQGTVLPGLEKVLNALDDKDPWMQLSFLVSPNHWLEGARPLDLLRNGAVDEVLRAAYSSGKQGGA
jgi:hypothetical protein